MIEFTAHELFKRHDSDQILEFLESLEADEDVKSIPEISKLEEMAREQQKIEHTLTRWEAAKLYKNATFYIVICVWTMILWGYENQAGGMVLSIPEFRKDFGSPFKGEYVLPASWQSAISGGPTGMVALGAMAGSGLADIFGKRRIMMLASLLSIPFITLEYVATTIEVFFVGKFMNAGCLGIIAACATTYVSEIAPLALRGISSAALALSLCIGPFVCVLINNTTSTFTTRMAYRAIFIPQWIFAITSIAGQCFLPESPYFLLSKGRDKDAWKSLSRMYDDRIDYQYALMKVTVEEATAISAKSGTYLDCFRKKDLRRTLLVIFPFFMQAFCGVAYVSNYSTYYYQISGFDTQKSFQIACGAQALSVSGVICSFFIIDRFGRRPLMIAGMVMITLVNLLVAATGLKLSNRAAVTTSAAFMAMYNFFYNIAIGPLPYILGNELLSVFLRVKSLAIGFFINNAFQCMWSSVLPFMFNPDKANMGSSINFIFTGFSFVSVIIFYLYLPETAHRSFEEIDELFALKINAKRWKKYKTEKEIQIDQVTKSQVDHAERA